MGLEDAIPGDTNASSSSSKQRSSSSEKTYKFGSGQYSKEFKEEKWERIKAILKNELGVPPQEVVNNWSAEERFEILHEAALIDEQEDNPDTSTESLDSCEVCGSSNASLVEIEGYFFCPQHPAAKVSKELE